MLAPLRMGQLYGLADARCTSVEQDAWGSHVTGDLNQEVFRLQSGFSP